MPVDYTARAAQVGRIIAHVGQANPTTGELSWKLPGGALLYFSALILEDKRDPSDALRDDSDESTVRVLVAASAFAEAFPRVGQAFADPAGRSYRIQKVLSPPYSPTAAFRCGNVV